MFDNLLVFPAIPVSADLGALLIGVVGGGFGLYQYFIGQKWKRSEFAAQQLDKLLTDPDLAMCCVFLDWRERKLIVPERYKALTDKTSFVHDWVALEGALVRDTDASSFTWQEVIYRDCFDRFFTYLDQINHFISIRLFSTNDVYSLKYWINIINEPQYTENKHLFDQFIRGYGYSGVEELTRRFERVEKQRRWLRFFKTAENEPAPTPLPEAAIPDQAE